MSVATSGLPIRLVTARTSGAASRTARSSASASTIAVSSETSGARVLWMTRSPSSSCGTKLLPLLAKAKPPRPSKPSASSRINAGTRRARSSTGRYTQVERADQQRVALGHVAMAQDQPRLRPG